MRKRGSVVSIGIILIIIAILSSILVLSYDTGDFICEVNDQCVDAGQTGCTDISNKHPAFPGEGQCDQLEFCCAKTNAGAFCEVKPLTECSFSNIAIPAASSCLDITKEPRCEQGCCQKRDQNGLLVTEADDIYLIDCQERTTSNMVFSPSCLPSGEPVPQNNVLFNIYQTGTTTPVTGATISSVVKTVADQSTPNDLDNDLGQVNILHDVGIYYFTISATNYIPKVMTYEVSSTSQGTYDVYLDYNPVSLARINFNVVDDATGVGIEGVTISCLELGCTAIGYTLSTGELTLDVPIAEAGTRTFSFSHPNYNSESHSFNLDPTTPANPPNVRLTQKATGATCTGDGDCDPTSERCDLNTGQCVEYCSDFYGDIKHCTQPSICTDPTVGGTVDNRLSCGGGLSCCDTNPVAILGGCSVNSIISEGQQCYCGDTYVKYEAGTTKFCCPTGVTTQQCDAKTYTIKGRLKNTEGQYVNGIGVYIEGYDATGQKSFPTQGIFLDETGYPPGVRRDGGFEFYLIPLSSLVSTINIYNIQGNEWIATWQYNDASKKLNGRDKTAGIDEFDVGDVILPYPGPERCSQDPEFSPRSPSVSALERGKPFIKTTWKLNSECTTEVSRVMVTRYKKIGNEFVAEDTFTDEFERFTNGQPGSGDNGFFYYSQTGIPETNFFYVDDTTQWENTYKYEIVVTSKKGNRATGNTIAMYTGDKVCDGMTIDDRFCLAQDRSASYKCENQGIDGYNVVQAELCGMELTQPTYCINAPPNGGNLQTTCSMSLDCSNLGTKYDGTLFGQSNFFGILNLKEYSGTSCEDQPLCYLDYAEYENNEFQRKPTDSCANCDRISSCLDYKSEYACEKNTCQIGDITKKSGTGEYECDWIEIPATTNLGEGLCVKATSQEEECNKCDDLGLLIGCTEKVCGDIGECGKTRNDRLIEEFSAIVSSPIEECTGCSNIKDRDITGKGCTLFTEENCNLDVQTDITDPGYGYADELKNTCGIDLCVWGTLSSQATRTVQRPNFYPSNQDTTLGGRVCRKAICDRLDENRYTLILDDNQFNERFAECEIDLEPPVTTASITKKSTVSEQVTNALYTENSAAQFEIFSEGLFEEDITGAKLRLYYCFGTDINTECLDPTNNEWTELIISFQQAKLLGIEVDAINIENGKYNQVFYEDNGQGEYTIPKSGLGVRGFVKYYTEDQNFNQEKIQNKSFPIDTQPPEITLDTSGQEYELTEVVPGTSNLLIQYTINDDAFGGCTETVIRTDQYQVVHTETKLVLETDTPQIAISNILDGIYSVKITCKDGFGNVDEIQRVIHSDTDTEIDRQSIIATYAVGTAEIPLQDLGIRINGQNFKLQANTTIHTGTSGSDAFQHSNCYFKFFDLNNNQLTLNTVGKTQEEMLEGCGRKPADDCKKTGEIYYAHLQNQNPSGIYKVTYTCSQDFVVPGGTQRVDDTETFNLVIDNKIPELTLYKNGNIFDAFIPTAAGPPKQLLSNPSVKAADEFSLKCRDIRQRVPVPSAIKWFSQIDPATGSSNIDTATLDRSVFRDQIIIVPVYSYQTMITQKVGSCNYITEVYESGTKVTESLILKNDQITTNDYNNFIFENFEMNGEKEYTFKIKKLGTCTGYITIPTISSGEPDSKVIIADDSFMPTEAGCPEVLYSKTDLASLTRFIEGTSEFSLDTSRVIYARATDNEGNENAVDFHFEDRVDGAPPVINLPIISVPGDTDNYVQSDVEITDVAVSVGISDEKAVNTPKPIAWARVINYTNPTEQDDPKHWNQYQLATTDTFQANVPMTYAGTITLKPGKNKIVIFARDEIGQTQKKEVELIYYLDAINPNLAENGIFIENTDSLRKNAEYVIEENKFTLEKKENYTFTIIGEDPKYTEIISSVRIEFPQNTDFDFDLNDDGNIETLNTFIGNLTQEENNFIFAGATYTFNVIIIDAAGNQHTETFNLEIKDTSPPKILAAEIVNCVEANKCVDESTTTEKVFRLGGGTTTFHTLRLVFDEEVIREIDEFEYFVERGSWQSSTAPKPTEFRDAGIKAERYYTFTIFGSPDETPAKVELRGIYSKDSPGEHPLNFDSTQFFTIIKDLDVPPQPTIETPLDHSFFKEGETINFRGVATGARQLEIKREGEEDFFHDDPFEPNPKLNENQITISESTLAYASNQICIPYPIMLNQLDDKQALHDNSGHYLSLGGSTQYYQYTFDKDNTKPFDQTVCGVTDPAYEYHLINLVNGPATLPTQTGTLRINIYTNSEPAGLFEFVNATTQLIQDTYIYELEAIDAVSNKAEPKEITFYVDKTAPTFHITPLHNAKSDLKYGAQINILEQFDLDPIGQHNSLDLSTVQIRLKNQDTGKVLDITEITFGSQTYATGGGATPATTDLQVQTTGTTTHINIPKEIFREADIIAQRTCVGGTENIDNVIIHVVSATDKAGNVGSSAQKVFTYDPCSYGIRIDLDQTQQGREVPEATEPSRFRGSTTGKAYEKHFYVNNLASTTVDLNVRYDVSRIPGFKTAISEAKAEANQDPGIEVDPLAISEISDNYHKIRFHGLENRKDYQIKIESHLVDENDPSSVGGDYFHYVWLHVDNDNPIINGITSSDSSLSATRGVQEVYVSNENDVLNLNIEFTEVSNSPEETGYKLNVTTPTLDELDFTETQNIMYNNPLKVTGNSLTPDTINKPHIVLKIDPTEAETNNGWMQKPIEIRLEDKAQNVHTMTFNNFYIDLNKPTITTKVDGVLESWKQHLPDNGNDINLYCECNDRTESGCQSQLTYYVSEKLSQETYENDETISKLINDSYESSSNYATGQALNLDSFENGEEGYYAIGCYGIDKAGNVNYSVARAHIDNKGPDILPQSNPDASSSSFYHVDRGEDKYFTMYDNPEIYFKTNENAQCGIALDYSLTPPATISISGAFQKEHKFTLNPASGILSPSGNRVHIKCVDSKTNSEIKTMEVLKNAQSYNIELTLNQQIFTEESIPIQFDMRVTETNQRFKIGCTYDFENPADTTLLQNIFVDLTEDSEFSTTQQVRYTDFEDATGDFIGLPDDGSGAYTVDVTANCMNYYGMPSQAFGQFQYRPNTQLQIELVEPKEGDKFINLEDVFIRADTNIFGHPQDLNCFFSVNPLGQSANSENLDRSTLTSQTFSGYSSVFIHEGIPAYLIETTGEQYALSVTCTYGGQPAVATNPITITIDTSPPEIIELVLYDSACDNADKQLLPSYDLGTGLQYYTKATEICVTTELNEVREDIESVEINYPSSTRDITSDLVVGTGILTSATTLNLNLREGEQDEIIIIATDNLGNDPSTLTKTILLDQTPPTIEPVIVDSNNRLGDALTKDGKYLYKVNDAEPFTITATTDESAIIELWESTQLDTSTDYVTTIPLDATLGIGEHTYQIKAKDRAGNEQTPTEIIIINDHTAPQVVVSANNKPEHGKIVGKNFGVLQPTFELYFTDKTGIKYGNFTLYRAFMAGNQIDYTEKLTEEWLEIIPSDLGGDEYKFTLNVANDLNPNHIYWHDFYYYIAYSVMDNLTNTLAVNNTEIFAFGVNTEAPQISNADLENQYWQSSTQPLIITYNQHATKRDENVKIIEVLATEKSYTATEMVTTDFANYDTYLSGEVIAEEGTGRRRFTITPNSEWTCSHCNIHLTTQTVTAAGEPTNAVTQEDDIIFYIDRDDPQITEIQLDSENIILYNGLDLREDEHSTETDLTGIRTKNPILTITTTFKDEKILDGAEHRTLTITKDGTPTFNGEIESDRDEDTHSVYEHVQEITLTTGDNLITIVVTDKSGRTNTFTRTIRLDEEEPSITALGFNYENTITDDTTEATNIIFKTNLADFDLTGGYTTDDDAIIYLSGTDYTYNDATQPSGTFTIPSIILDQPSSGREEENNLEIIIEDSVGNTQTYPIKVIVDKKEPELALVDTANTEIDIVGGDQIYYRYESNAINLTVKSTTEQITSCNMYFGGLSVEAMSPTGDGKFFYETGALIGNYDFYVTCQDRFGNEKRLDSKLWYYDQPIITGINPVLDPLLFIHPERFEDEFDLVTTSVPETSEIKCEYEFLLDEGSRPKLDFATLTYEEMHEDDEWEQTTYLPWGSKGKDKLQSIITGGYTDNFLAVNVTCKDRSGTEIDQLVPFETDDDFVIQFKFDQPPMHKESDWVADKKIRTGEKFSIIVNRPDAQCSVTGNPNIALLENPTTINDAEYKLATKYEFEQAIAPTASGRSSNPLLPDDAAELTVSCQKIGQPIQTKTLKYVGDNTEPNVPELNIERTGYNKTDQIVNFKIDNLQGLNGVLENNMNDSVIRVLAENVNGGPIYDEIEYNVSPDTPNDYEFTFTFEDLIKEQLDGEVEEKYNIWVRAWDDLEHGPVASNLIEITYDNKSPTIESYNVENSIQNGNVYYVSSNPVITGTVSEFNTQVTNDGFTNLATITVNTYSITLTLSDDTDTTINLQAKDAFENVGEQTDTITLHKDTTGPTFIDATGGITIEAAFGDLKFKELNQLLITYEDNSGFSSTQSPIMIEAIRDGVDVMAEASITSYSDLDEDNNGFNERKVYEVALTNGFTSPSATEASEYQIAVGVRDSHGKTATTRIRFTIDPRIPTIDVETNNVRNNVNEFKFNISDNTNNIETSTLNVEVDGSEEGIATYSYADMSCDDTTVANGYECTITTTLTQSQTVNYEIYVEDDLGNSNTVTGSYEYDITPISTDHSTIKIEEESSNYDILADGKTNVSFEIIDHVSGEEVSCSYNLDVDATYQQMIDGGTSEVVTVYTTNLIQFLDVFNSAGSTDGTHTLYVACRDEAGNLNENIDIPFRVDTSTPTITNLVVTPSSGEIRGGQTGNDYAFETGDNIITISGTYTSNDGVTITTKSIGQVYTHEDTTSDGTFELTTVILETHASGNAKLTNELTLTITDEAGNVNDNLKVNITIDKEKPKLEIIETNNAVVGRVGKDLVYWTKSSAAVNLAVEANEYLSSCTIKFSGIDEPLTNKPADNKYTYSLANFGGISWDFEITCLDRYQNSKTLYSTLKKYNEQPMDELELRINPLVISSPISEHFSLEILPKRDGIYLDDPDLHGIQCEYDFIGLGALSEQSQFVLTKEELYENGEWQLPVILPKEDGKGNEKLDSLVNAQYRIDATCRNLGLTELTESITFGVNTAYDTNFKFVQPETQEDSVNCETCTANRKIRGGETLKILANKGDLACNLDGAVPLTEGALNGDVDFPLGVEFTFTAPTNAAADGSNLDTLEITCISNADVTDVQEKLLNYYEDNQKPQENPVLALTSNRFNQTTQTVTVQITNIATLTEHNMHDGKLLLHAKDTATNDEYEKEFVINSGTTELTFAFNELITDNPGIDAEKEYKIWAEVWDDVENGPVTSVSTPQTIYYDNLAPVASFEYTGETHANELTERVITIHLSEESNLRVVDGTTQLITIPRANEGSRYGFDPVDYGSIFKTYIIKAKPIDLTGNEGSWTNTISLTYNNLPPVLSNELPTDESTVGGTQVDFSIKAQDENGLDTNTLQILIDGTEVVADATTTAPVITTTHAGTRGTITFTKTGMTAGTYVLTANINDLLGNQGSRTDWEITINNDAPTTPTWTVPQHTNNQQQPVTITFNENVEITSATMAGTEATVDPATAGTTFTVTPTADLAGTDEEKEIIVVVNAHLETGTGVNYPFTKKFIIDTLEPVINSYESIPTESTVDLNEITLLGTYTENNLDKIEINQSAQVHKTRLYGITSFINESISLNPGQNSFTAIAYDLAGNEGRAEIAIYYDNTNPEINDVSLQITGITRETDGTFIVNVADGETITLTGTYTSNEPVTITSDLGEVILVGTEGFTITGEVRGTDGTEETDRVTILISDGTYTSSVTITIINDRQAPTATLELPLLGFTNDVTPEIKISTDQTAALCNITYQASETEMTPDGDDFTYTFTNTLAETTHTILVGCEDERANYEETPLEFTVDLTPPEYVNSFVDAEQQTPDNFLLYSTDTTRLHIDTFDVIKCKYKLSTETTYTLMGLNYGNSHTSQDITLTNGDYIYNVTCEDRAGNEKEKEVNLTVNTNLLIQATTNFNGQSINDNQPQIIVTTDRESVCTAGGSGYHTLNEGGTEVTQFISTDTITHNAYLSSQASTPAPLADDTYTVEITCQSLAPGIGEGTTTATFTIDTNVNPPVITNFVDNPTIPIVTEYPDVSFTVDEEVTATILVNDKPKETQTNLLPGTIHTFENVQLANKGVNIVTIGIIDEAGNENFASILINLSTDNPVIDETKSRHPDHNRIYGGLNESYTYFNSDLDITSAEITLEGDEGTTYNDGTITIDNLNRKIIYNETGTLASDNYTLQINITDTSGRKSENSIIRFEIDLESPVISVTSPGGDEVVTSQIVTVTATTDKELEKATFTVNGQTQTLTPVIPPFTFTTQELAEGRHEYEINGTRYCPTADCGFKTGTYKNSFIIDVTGPTYSGIEYQGGINHLVQLINENVDGYEYKEYESVPQTEMHPDLKTLGLQNQILVLYENISNSEDVELAIFEFATVQGVQDYISLIQAANSDLTTQNWAIRSEVIILSLDKELIQKGYVLGAPFSAASVVDHLIRDVTPSITFFFDEPTTITHKLEDSSRTQKQSTATPMGEATSFTITATEQLMEETHKIILTASDVYGNQEVQEFSFSILADPFEITLIEPPFGYTKEETTKVVIETSRDGECKWTTNLDWNYDQAIPFNKFTQTQHNITDFDRYGQQLKILCKDTGYSNQIIEERFIITRDAEDLNVELFMDDVETLTGTLQAVSTVTGKTMVCYYNESGLWQIFDGLNERIESSYQAIQRQTFTVGGYLVDESVNEIEILCKDKAQNAWTRLIDVKVNTSRDFSLEIIKPEVNFKTSEPEIDIQVKTNRDASCKYRIDTGNLVGLDSANNRDHTRTRGQLGSGTHNLQIECEEMGVGTPIYENRTFYIDTTEPEMIIVQIKDLVDDKYTYYEEKVKFYLAAYDNESGITKFNLTLYEKGENDPLKSVTLSGVRSKDVVDDLADCLSDADEDDDERDECYDATTLTGSEIDDIENCLEDEDSEFRISKSEARTCIEESVTDREYDLTYYIDDDVRERDIENDTDYIIVASAMNGVGMWSDEIESEEFTVNFEKAPASCSDDKKNGNETDEDCGGNECRSCNIGKTCREDDDCSSDNCVLGVCKTPSCTDGKQNGDETDEDCGGSCTGCEVDERCLRNSDCESNKCDIVNEICKEDPCNNGIKDVGEAYIDCGGSCPIKCDPGDSCTKNSDCKSGNCKDEVCVTTFSDTDNDGINDVDDNCMSVANSAQTDIDGDNKGDECDVDIDGDRMDNDWEIRYGLNQRFVGDANGDIDLDGLTNVQEYDEGTDPTNPDSDGDGMSDGEEVAKGRNPRVEDSSILKTVLITLLVLAALGVVGFIAYQKFAKPPLSPPSTPRALKPSTKKLPSIRKSLPPLSKKLPPLGKKIPQLKKKVHLKKTLKKPLTKKPLTKKVLPKPKKTTVSKPTPKKPVEEYISLNEIKKKPTQKKITKKQDALTKLKELKRTKPTKEATQKTEKTDAFAKLKKMRKK